MSQGTNAAILMALCAAAAACNEAPPGTLTEPETVTPGTAGAAKQGLSLLAAGNPWAAKRSLPRPNTGMAAGTINGIIYLVGGNSSQFTAIARVNAYNVATKTWSEVQSLPGGRAEPNGASVIKGKLYVTGGTEAG
jgi:N-acetylneuraminic acid mutarotase